MAVIVNFKNNTGKIFERTNTLMGYFNDIKRFEIGLSREEEEILFDYYKNGTKKEKAAARRKLIESNQRFVVSVARAYATNNNLMDLIEEGNIGLMEAIDAFNPDVKVNDRTVKFMTFAVHYIRRAINQYKMSYDTIVKKNNISKTYHVISRARNKFIQENGRQPTTEELMEVVNKDFGLRIKESMDMLDVNVMRIDNGVEDSDEDGGASFSAMMRFNSHSANVNDYEKVMDANYENQMVSAILKSLTPRERRVMKMAFGIGEYREFTNAEIGEKLGVTPERVRQMKTAIIRRLQRCGKRHFSDR